MRCTLKISTSSFGLQFEDCRADLLGSHHHSSYPDHFSPRGVPAAGQLASASATASAPLHDYPSVSRPPAYPSAAPMVTDYHNGTSPAAWYHAPPPHPFPPALYSPSPLHVRHGMDGSHPTHCGGHPQAPSFSGCSYASTAGHPGPDERWRMPRSEMNGMGGYGGMGAEQMSHGMRGHPNHQHQQLGFNPFVIGGPPGQENGDIFGPMEFSDERTVPISMSNRRPNSKDSAHPDNQIFDSVPGRLSLLSSSSKYKVTVGEIKRRISAPECLNASLLGGVLRRAKSKNGGSNLRGKLEKIGLNLPAGRRKGATVTLLSSLVEEESIKLAADFKTICDQYFPSKVFAEHLVKALSSEVTGNQNPANLIRSTQLVIRILLDIMRRDRSPVGQRKPLPANVPSLDAALQRQLTTFNLLSHGFGGPAMICVMDTMRSVLGFMEEEVAMVNGGSEGKKISSKSDKKQTEEL